MAQPLPSDAPAHVLLWERQSPHVPPPHCVVGQLVEALSTIALTQFEAETCFRARATQGSVVTGLQLLEKLDTLTGQELEQT
jgi:hypothetical protein